MEVEWFVCLYVYNICLHIHTRSITLFYHQNMKVFRLRRISCMIYASNTLDISIVNPHLYCLIPRWTDDYELKFVVPKHYCNVWTAEALPQIVWSLVYMPLWLPSILGRRTPQTGDTVSVLGLGRSPGYSNVTGPPADCSKENSYTSWDLTNNNICK